VVADMPYRLGPDAVGAALLEVWQAAHFFAGQAAPSRRGGLQKLSIGADGAGRGLPCRRLVLPSFTGDFFVGPASPGRIGREKARWR